MEVQFKSHKREVKDAIDAALVRGLRACGGQAERYAKQLSPFITGFLRNSITFAIAGESPKTTKYEADVGDRQGSYQGSAPTDDKIAMYVGTNVEYAPMVELGTYRSEARPFLKPAIVDHIDDYKKIMENELKKR